MGWLIVSCASHVAALSDLLLVGKVFQSILVPCTTEQMQSSTTNNNKKDLLL